VFRLTTVAAMSLIPVSTWESGFFVGDEETGFSRAPGCDWASHWMRCPLSLFFAFSSCVRVFVGFFWLPYVLCQYNYPRLLF